VNVESIFGRMFPFRLLIITLWAAGAVSVAQAESLAFRGVWQNENVAAVVQTVDVDGQTFVPLASLAEQLGGQITYDEGRIQIDLGSNRAWIEAGGRTAYGTLDRLSLSQPIAVQNDTVLLALDDVPRLFATCFRIDLARAGSTAANTAETAAQLDSNRLEDPFAPGVLEGLDVAASQPVRNRPTFSRIFLDPGHGGGDSGAVGPAGLEEKTVTLAVAELLKAELTEALDAEVVLTRSDDRELSTAHRGNLAVREKGDLFLSIHTGASISQPAYGFEIFCVPPISSGRLPTTRVDISMQLARHIEQALSRTTETVSRGIRRAPLRPHTNLNIPSLLIEIGCITNPTEEAMLQSEDYQRQLAAGIAEGIVGYVSGSVGDLKE
jgi:N-acetylmuramoyl-L-alanine amidase